MARDGPLRASSGAMLVRFVLPSFPQALALVGIGVIAYLSFLGVGAPGRWPDGMAVGCVVVAGLAMVVRRR